MQSGRIRAVFATALLTLCLSATAAPKPDFTGAWRLNLEKSDFGPLPAPQAGGSKIEHRDPILKVRVTRTGDNGESSSDLKLTTDGKESVDTVDGLAVKSTAHWDGEALVIESRLSVDGNQVTITQRWTLSRDGKVLTMVRKIASPDGDASQSFVHANGREDDRNETSP
jgi:hypothetical protein